MTITKPRWSFIKLRVLADKDAEVDGDIRVIDESGEDYLYPADWFVFIELPHALEKSLLRAA